MKAQANTTREQSNKKSKQVGDPRTVEMEEQEKNNKKFLKAHLKIEKLKDLKNYFKTKIKTNIY